MENQTHYIQALLTDKLDRCKGKENHLVNENIKIIQNAYQKIHEDIPQLMIVDKGKQKEDRLQDEVNNLEKAMTLLQSPTKTIPFCPPPYYKSLQSNRELNEQYWKEVTVKFLKQKHNTDITR